MDIYLLLSLSIYFSAMLAIGLFAFKANDNSVAGFLLGGRNVGPKVTALSAGASDMSGWMLMGLPGAMYITGLASSWIGIGLVIGAWCNYLFVAPRLRVYTELTQSVTIPDFFERRFADNSHLLRIISAAVIIIFFAIYTTSGVVAGGKLFESAFNLNYETGLYVTSAIVVLYTLFGGYLAVSMTDFVQGCIMFVALILVPVIAIFDMGGAGAVIDTITSVNSDAFNMLSGVSVLAIVSSMAWGLGYFGQPHIIVRFMAIKSVHQLPTARRIGMSWMIITLIGALLVGLTGVAYTTINDIKLADPETIFIVYANSLFHPFVAGFLLAAILAAIMSTISSQLLVTSSSLANDLYSELFNKEASQKQVLLVSRISIFLVALLAVVIAHDRNSTILSLVSNAWAGFGAAFGPLILISLFWSGITRAGAIAGILSGAITVLIWIYAPLGSGGSTWSHIIYEMVPGVAVSALAIFIVSKMSQAPDDDLVAQFKSMETKVTEKV